MQTDYLVVFVTVGEEEQAKKIAREILSKKLAACVNIVPDISSSYLWKGNIETDNEILLIIKTKRVLFDELVDIVKKNHTYEIPEIIGLPILYGNKEYLNWIEEEVLS